MNSKANDLAALNDFVQADNGVWSAASANTDFAYSDGHATEVLLKKILSKAQDLRSDSAELLAEIVDWPTEYHLSATRANLLRPLNLDGVTRVLELGCGCGSISRYLGEQVGVQVDSVEGSAVRAELAALRCADLDNVSISTANFNDIQLPQDYYDLVLFVGVTEYAGRFSTQPTDQEALQDLLKMAKAATKEQGVVLVAIENRVGLKYLLGANEDHYALPFVGLDDYPQSTGIRTYSQSEWREQIAAAGFAASRFCYPFPDYKVPTLVLGEDCNTAEAAAAMRSIVSRDYNSNFAAGQHEARIWQGLAITESLGEHANSFLILLSNSQQSIAKMSTFTIAQYPIPELEYRRAAPKIEPLIADDEQLKQARAELRQLTAHANDLEQTIEIMAGSSGWKWMNRLRKLFGKPSVR